MRLLQLAAAEAGPVSNGVAVVVILVAILFVIFAIDKGGRKK